MLYIKKIITSVIAISVVAPLFVFFSLDNLDTYAQVLTAEERAVLEAELAKERELLKQQEALLAEQKKIGLKISRTPEDKERSKALGKLYDEALAGSNEAKKIKRSEEDIQGLEKRANYLEKYDIRQGDVVRDLRIQIA